MNKNFYLFFVFIFVSLLNAQTWDTVKIAKLFDGHAGTMVIYDRAQNKSYKYNSLRSAERFLPASTFKIPNSLIGLESKALQDENTVIAWDGIERPMKEWNRDHTLASAIKYSVVPYYQKLAKNVGKKKYSKFLKALNYGNQKIGDRIDSFWLDNSLKNSADEQIDFLRNFYDYKVPFSKRNVDIVKKIIPEEKYKNSILKFKTGTGNKEDESWIGWLVGYVETKTNVFFYAFNVDGKTYDEAKNIRDLLPRKILEQYGFIK